MQPIWARDPVPAWRIHWITLLQREDPESPCDQILEKHEWQALYCRMHKVKIPPQTPPSVRQAIR